jgi:uncharacterized membrane protein YfcA
MDGDAGTGQGSPMDAPAQLLAHGALFAAGLLQGVTGIGFALIAGPVLLLALDAGAAAPISALLCCAVALSLAARSWRHIAPRLLARFAVAAVCAAPLGLALLASATVPILKLAAGAALAAMTALMLAGRRRAAAGPALPGDLAAGAVAGALGGALSILGPPIALRMAARGVENAVNRATVQAFFVLLYPPLFLAQSAVLGAGAPTLGQVLAYVPASLFGAAAGHALAGRVSAALFRRLVIAVLIVTAAALILDGARGLALEHTP